MARRNALPITHGYVDLFKKKVKDISAEGGILLSESMGRCLAEDFRLEQLEIDIEGGTLVAYAVTGRA